MIRTLLLVDDEENITLALVRLLRKDGYQILTANSASEALKILENHFVDVVLTDQRMPEISGVELLLEVKHRFPHAVRLLLSGYSDLESMKAAINQGAIYKYLTKPWDNDVLRRTVKDAFSKHELIQERERITRQINAANKSLAELNQELEKLVSEKNKHIDIITHYDATTALPNRLLFCTRLEEILAQAKIDKKFVAVLLLDLDHFKYINDSLGHFVGDKILEAVAIRLKTCLRNDDMIGRTGGDEFSIIMNGLINPEDVSNKARELLKILAPAFYINEHEIFVSSSIGVSIYPTDGDEVVVLNKNAEIAMYQAKHTCRNSMQFYAEGMNANAQLRLSMESGLRRALERDEFVLYYQPQVYIGSGQIFGVEALLRWKHPDKGLIPPAEFIPLLEETGLIVPVGEWIIRAVATQLKAWQFAQLPPLRVAINLSAVQFAQSNLDQTISRILNEVELDCSSGCLELELTESLLMHDVESAITTLNTLHQMGIQISIDDFGTGYSSLSHLKRFPIDTLKIDQSFVKNLASHADDTAIVSAIIALGHSLKLKVIAEGVETEEQLVCLRSIQCDEVQGYLFSKPVQAQEISRLLENNSLFINRSSK